MKKKKSKTEIASKPRLNDVDRMKAKAWETIFIGTIANEMGYVEQSRVCKAGMEVFKKIGTMTYDEFKNIKALLSGT